MDVALAEAVTEKPNTDALNASGIRLAKDGKLSDAVGVFREAIALEPGHAQAHHNLGVALAEAGRLEEAMDSFRAAIRARPDYAEAHCGLGNTFAAKKLHDQAAQSYRRALAARADHFGALNGLGLSLTALKRPAEAAVIFRQAVRLRPDEAATQNNLGLALNDQGSYSEAETAFGSALQLDPGYAEAHVNLGNSFKEQGRVAEALVCYDMAVWLRPDSAAAHWNRSLALLQAGDYTAGWEEYEWRWARNGAAERRFGRPLWDGSPLEGRTILLHMEQGLGDVLMFIRFAALVKETGGSVIAEYPAPLAHILQTCPAIDAWFAEGAELPEFQVHAPIMSLPRLLETTLDSIPAAVPYLFADPERVEHWRQRLSELTGLKVGIAWQGNPHHAWDSHRSVPLTSFAPLAQIPGVDLISLQRGPGIEQLTSGTGAQLGVHDVLDTSLSDSDAMMEVAAVMQSLDLVVSVDTATAHLAGALNVPTWTLLSTMVDWRWMLDRADTPWYPQMRLFRQRQRDRWDDVFEHVADELGDKVSSSRKQDASSP